MPDARQAIPINLDLSVHMAREIQPYSFEPEHSDTELTVGYEESSNSDHDTEPETNDLRNHLEARVGQAADWCLCGLCQPLPTALECQCCCESSRVTVKKNEISLPERCITTTVFVFPMFGS